MKYIYIVPILIVLWGSMGCDEWHEVKRTQGFREGNHWASLMPWRKPTMIIIEENQDGERRMYSITMNGKKRYIEMAFVEKFFGKEKQ